MRSQILLQLAAFIPSLIPQVSAATSCSYWLDQITHSGVAAYNSDTSYKVYRNVKDYGAKGDGVTDDTKAINAAIQAGAGRVNNQSSTNTLAVVYFPPGTYSISSSIINYFYTQLIGNPNCMPVIKGTANFQGFGLIDNDPYGANGLTLLSTTVFYRQVNNFIFDTTSIPGAATGIHWPTAQATSVFNCIFKMSDAPNTQHQGIFIEEGSGGWMTDLTFYGGLYGMNQGNQQFTMRNLTFYNSVTAINQIWDWGWTYKNININNCSVGLNISSGGRTAQTVGSVVLIDSVFNNVKTGIITAYDASSSPYAAGSLILENVVFKNVGGKVVNLNGSSVDNNTTIAAYAQGNEYLPSRRLKVQGELAANPRPAILMGGPNNGFYERSKPQYASLAVNQFVSARAAGAKGDGFADDTAALLNAIKLANTNGSVVFINAGTYLVSNTIYIPAGTRITGEGYAVIMSTGSTFSNINNPVPVLQVGKAGEKGQVELSNLILSTQSQPGQGQGGAVLVQWNLASPDGSPSGMWDVHVRLGGSLATFQQGGKCAKNPSSTVTASSILPQCIVAYMAMHITKSASGVYLENVWLWTADHDLDGQFGFPQLTLYSGRGLLVESVGPTWLYGTSSEHHVLYQYQFNGAQNIFAGQIQTETAYYQPNPGASIPFPANATLNDPVFATSSSGNIPTVDGWGLRIVNGCKKILIYGAGLYSFFNNYSTNCSAQGNGEVCQLRIFQVNSSEVYLYDLHTVGTNQIINLNGNDIATYSDNVAGFTEEVAVFRTQ